LNCEGKLKVDVFGFIYYDEIGFEETVVDKKDLRRTGNLKKYTQDEANKIQLEMVMKSFERWGSEPI